MIYVIRTPKAETLASFVTTHIEPVTSDVADEYVNPCAVRLTYSQYFYIKRFWSRSADNRNRYQVRNDRLN